MALERRSGFKPDHKSMGVFILSDQARQPAVQAAHDVVPIARALQDAADGPSTKRREGAERMAGNYKVNENTTPVIVGGNPRVGAEVYNDKRYAAAREFGHNREGGTHALRRAGAQIGELRGGDDG